MGERIHILKTPVDAYSFAETVRCAHEAMTGSQVIRQVSLNVAKLVKMRSDPLLRADVLSSDIISADGMGIVWGCKVLGLQLPSRVPGVDLMMALLDLCAKEGFRPYFLGATPKVLEEAVRKATERWPELQVAGIHHGYFKPEEEPAIVEEIVRAKPHCLFIAMPTPRKERFLAQHQARLRVPFIMGVGGSLDVLAGETSRAPYWMQAGGLEWFYRIMQEPRRMWWRYASTNTVFAWLVLTALSQMLFAKIVQRHRHVD